MPTGYTQLIQEGADFKTYALACARAFGALIEMRDDPMDAKIPEEFKPSPYHAEKLVEAERELSNFLNMPDNLKLEMEQKEFDDEMKVYNKSVFLRSEIRKKYEDVLRQCKEYVAPSENHEEFKKFMIEQIEKSIDWDCSEPQAPIRLSFDAWVSKTEKSLKWSVDYHSKEYKAEIERVRQRNEWVSQLRKSLN